jgi:hypothetical protein
MRYLRLCSFFVLGVIAISVLNFAVCALVGYRYPADFSPLPTGLHEASLMMIGAIVITLCRKYVR